MGRDRGKWQRKKEGGETRKAKIIKRLGQGGSERKKKDVSDFIDGVDLQCLTN